MVDVVLALQGGNVRASKCPSALVAQQIEPPEVVRLAQRILPLAVLVFGREEFGCYDLATVLNPEGRLASRWSMKRAKGGDDPLTDGRRVPYLAFKTVEMKGAIEGPNKLARQGLSTRVANPLLAAGGSPAPPSRPIPLSTLAEGLLLIPSSRRRIRGRGRRTGGPQSVAAFRCPVVAVLPVWIGRVTQVLAGEVVCMGVVAVAMVGGRRIVVTRGHHDKQSRAWLCTDPPPGPEPIKSGWPLSAKFPTVVDERLQRSASAPA